MKCAETYALVAVFSILAGGLVCAEESSADGSRQKTPAKAVEERQNESRFSDTSSQPRNQTDGSIEEKADNKSRFVGKSQKQAKNKTTPTGSIEVTIREDGFTIEVEEPVTVKKGGTPPKQGTPSWKAGQNGRSRAEELVLKEQNKAMDRRRAGKKAAESLDRIQEQTQSGLDEAFDNLKRANEAIEN